MQYPDFYTKKMIQISERNKAALRKKLNPPKGYQFHHIDPTWRWNDPWRYIQWNEDDVIAVSPEEHGTYQVWNDERREKARQSQLKRFEDPAEREKTSKATKEGMHEPEKWERFIYANSHKGPENGEAISRAQKKRYENPEARKQCSEVSKRNWKDPDYRRRTSVPVRYVPTGQEFDSAKEAEAILGVSRSTICTSCKGKGKNRDWEYVDPNRQRIFERSI